MLHGKTLIKACPVCQELHYQRTMLSGNTFGGKMWSDTKKYYPMLIQTPRIVKCVKCNTISWLDTFKEVSGNSPISGKIKEITKEDFEQLFEYDLSRNKDEYIYLRILYWHKCNDESRGEVFSIDYSNTRLINILKQLLELLGNSIDELILKVEINRELKQFNEARSLIDKIMESEDISKYEKILSLMDKLVSDNDSRVFEMNL